MSLGYLVPALRWAARNGERTVVSTNTINLQEQLVGKDLPFLEQTLTDQKVRFALLKGWRNYLCLLRLEQAQSNEGALLDDGMQAELEGLDRKGKGLLSARVARLAGQTDLLSTASLDLVHARLAPSVHAARDKGAVVFDLLETLLHESGEPVLRLGADFDRH